MTDPAERVAEARRLFDLGTARHRAGDIATAIELYHRALAVAPAFADAYNNLAVALKTQKRFPAAIACLRQALTLAPQSGALHSNLGNLLWMTLEFDEAMAEFRQALALEPTRFEAWHNLGLLYFSRGDYAAAIDCYDRALALQSGSRLVPWDRALALLAAGDYARGFAAYEARFDLDDPTMGFDRRLRDVRSIPLPLWQGEDLAGRTLWVYAEQGFGDTIQFVRFLPLAAARGARIVFDVPQPLLRLFAALPGVAELRPEGSPVPVADVHLPLMSLPHRLGITLETLPRNIPYLAAPPADEGPRLVRPAGTQLAAGIVWAGRPAQSNDHNRSMPLEQMLELCGVPGLTLFSLQFGASATDIAAIGATPLVHDIGVQHHDFVETASLMQQLDLVITVDTAAAHLAGALGRPAFVLLPFTPDWRWLAQRTDSPWYPSLRLFRQQAPRDWRGVMRQVKETLAQMLAKPQ